MKKEKGEFGLAECYTFSQDKHSSSFSKRSIHSGYMKKKESKDRSLKNRSSNSNSRSKKHSNNKSSTSKPRKNVNQNQNIYIKRAKEDVEFHRSISPKPLNFKKTLTLKSVKSGPDLKGVLSARHP